MTGLVPTQCSFRPKASIVKVRSVNQPNIGEGANEGKGRKLESSTLTTTVVLEVYLTQQLPPPLDLPLIIGRVFFADFADEWASRRRVFP